MLGRAAVHSCYSEPELCVPAKCLYSNALNKLGLKEPGWSGLTVYVNMNDYDL